MDLDYDDNLAHAEEEEDENAESPAALPAPEGNSSPEVEARLRSILDPLIQWLFRNDIRSLRDLPLEKRPVQPTLYTLLQHQSIDWLVRHIIRHIPVQVQHILGKDDITVADLQSLPTIKWGNKSWGVYVNVPKTDDEARLYVGSTFARAGFKGRLKQHRAMPDPSSKGPRSGQRGKHANWTISLWSRGTNKSKGASLASLVRTGATQ